MGRLIRGLRSSSHLPGSIKKPKKPATPFKFGAAWLKHEEVLELMQSNWTPYRAEVGSHAATHLVQNLARVKKLLKERAKTKDTG